MKKALVLVLLMLLVSSAAYAVSVTLTWTAPADDVGLPTEGPVAAYKMVYSQLPINEANFDAGVIITTPTPKEPGQTESIVFDVLNGKHYYFAIKSADAQGNWSEISNVAQRDFMSPSVVGDLR